MKWKCGFWLSGLNWHDKKFKFVICINWSSFFLDFYPYFCIYASIEKGKKESSKYSACSNYPLALTSQSHHKTQKLNSFHITFFFFIKFFHQVWIIQNFLLDLLGHFYILEGGDPRNLKPITMVRGKVTRATLKN